MKNLEGKTALVTGGSRGIGAAIVKRLASEGARLAFTYGKSKEEADKLAAATNAQAYQADSGDMAAMKKLADTVAKDFGTIDILVNNAGVWSMGTIGEIAEEEYKRAMSVNVDGVFALTNAAIPHMKAGARIINISSGLGERATGPMMSTYIATKFAVVGLTRGWAKDLGAKNILVNAILPGPINTDMNPDSGPFAEYQRSNTALKRYGNPEEIAGVVAFLAGPDATYISGAQLAVDGGWNA